LFEHLNALLRSDGSVMRHATNSAERISNLST
jgi:hypothetical protein